MRLPSPAGGVLAAALLLLLLSSRALFDCPIPKDHNGMTAFSLSTQDSYPVGSTQKLQCITRYERIPGTSRVARCLENSTWLYPNFCRPKICPDPIIPNGGLIGAEGAEFVVFANFKPRCNPGYVLVGPKHIACGRNKKWHPSLPKCYLPGDVPTTTVLPKTARRTRKPPADEEELPPYPDPSKVPDESGYWKTVSIFLGCALAALYLTWLIFAAVAMSSSHGRKTQLPPAPPAPPEADYYVDYNVVSEGDMAFEEL